MGDVRFKPFPVQGVILPRGGSLPPTACSWEDAERAYAAYRRTYGSGGQSLERLAERGGFGRSEMDVFAPGWSEVPRG